MTQIIYKMFLFQKIKFLIFLLNFLIKNDKFNKKLIQILIQKN